ncbi:MAG: hypothetical protein ABIJ81_03800 [Patescibacteria group bacterium]
MKKLPILLLLSVVVLTGCSLKIGGGSTDGGIYRSLDKGVAWEQKVFISKGKKQDVTVGNINVNDILFSPLDNRVVYLLSSQSGVFVSANEAEQWEQIFPVGANAITLHPTKKDIIYVVSGNKIYRTLDGAQNWQQVYIEATPETGLNDIVIDFANPQVLYAVTSKGTLLKSSDAGTSWQAIYRFSKEISRLYLNPNNTAIIYAAMPSRGLWRSIDRGVTWTDLQPSLEEVVKRAGSYKKMVFIPGLSDGLLYATSYGLFQSVNGGQNWDNIELVTPPSSVGISMLSVNPQNNQEIYYAINTLIYYTSDGGKTWVINRSPSGRATTALTINPEDPNIMYLGVVKVKK